MSSSCVLRKKEETGEHLVSKTVINGDQLKIINFFQTKLNKLRILNAHSLCAPINSHTIKFNVH